MNHAVNMQSQSAAGLPAVRRSLATVFARWPDSWVYAWTQWFFTWLSGIPLPGQTLRKRSASEVFARSFIEIGISGAAAVALTERIVNDLAYGLPSMATGFEGLLLILFGLSLTGQKVMAQSVLIHWATHDRGLPNAWANRWVAEWLAILMIVTPFDAYQRDHGGSKGHHSKRFATPLDPDGQALIAWGFRPGMPRAALWQRYWLNIISPRFHGRLIAGRLRLVFGSGTTSRHLLAAGTWAVLLTILLLTSPWWAIAGYLLPVLIGGNVASMNQLLSEHRWFGEPELRGIKRQRALSHGRFLGDALPDAKLRLGQAMIAWVLWTARLLFRHLPARLTVLKGDLGYHVRHHEGTFGWEWLNPQAEFGAHAARLVAEDRAYFSLGSAIEAAFATIEAAPGDEAWDDLK